VDLYTTTAYKVSQQITTKYSTSFSSSAKLFPLSLRKHIYAIYGLVRIADEVVDTYGGSDTRILLEDLEQEVYAAITRGYSTNPIVHSFALTAHEFGITKKLIQPFFASMTLDIKQKNFTQKQYVQYIYGSAEVVGLMCLRVFVNGDENTYKQLQDGAQSLGSAYQKVNFLRDMRHDFMELGRVYFPSIDYETFDDAARDKIVADIEDDFNKAKTTAKKLPATSRPAVELSISYYELLLKKIKETSATALKTKRVRVANRTKAVLFLQAKVRYQRRHGY